MSLKLQQQQQIQVQQQRQQQQQMRKDGQVRHGYCQLDENITAQ
jgi:hypothetical protein